MDVKMKIGICQGLTKRELDFSRVKGCCPKQNSVPMETTLLYAFSTKSNIGSEQLSHVGKVG